MLTKEQNELLTRTGPGTPCGEFMRRYWQPVALSEELSADTPIPVRIMSENLVLYRGESGKPALLGLRCPHRGADLSYGRIEGEHLRCLYHGWLFGGDGRCLEQPSEPPGSTFKERIRQPAYCCEEAGGLIFGYLGPNPAPLLPALRFLSAPDAQVWCTKILHDCNYLQGSEGSFDPQHLSYLHRVQRGAARPDVNAMLAADTAPRIEVEEMPFGTRIYTSRSVDTDQAFVRVTNFIMPNCAAFGGQQRADPAVDRRDNDGYQLDWLVPIDDLRFWKYSVAYRYREALDKEYLQRSVMGEADEPYRMRRNAGNRYLQNRAEMKESTYTGLGVNFAIHDLWAVEAQGAVADRTAEHLGASDAAIIAMRRQMLKGIAAVQAGTDPAGVRRDAADDPHADVVVWSQRQSATAEVREFWRRAGEVTNV